MFIPTCIWSASPLTATPTHGFVAHGVGGRVRTPRLAAMVQRAGWHVQTTDRFLIFAVDGIVSPGLVAGEAVGRISSRG